MKSDIQNFKQLFHIENDGRKGGKCNCVWILAINKKMVKLAKACFTPFDFRKGKTGNLVVPDQSYN